MATTERTETGTGLRRDAIGLREVLFQSITDMAPGAAIAASIPAGVAFAAGSLPLAVVFALIACLFCAWSIGQLARAAEVAVSTVRFYERRGLVRPDARTRSNYRSYTPQSLERLRFIRAAQATGFSLKDVREMLGLTHSSMPPGHVLVVGEGRRHQGLARVPPEHQRRAGRHVHVAGREGQPQDHR